ncbi:UDP-N-acetylmuramoyl-tripeptide--D-alanyl-D-alanine ligase [Neotamlana laminarinivorans]|uniref:UDP-N-acetylmuramoyl-tripeptide--D-alanyl-D-alanine ligase n=1 Tax=Neotamlana laminarinivorans TaxID=2883124 RepID=A0A9X1I217_9FLAO|nr:UDP-N-acetylmuramoyl-tripeptide--D-alanyl-D-alanine ligase [Tamlana laminarinivorans]MCB4799173.1 UDP-N-acetylmuramoyl-tripeptide--D-alanyl-D-alanine ligase [Tamlana laminarinivorans]
MEIAKLHQLFLNCNAANTDTRKIKLNDMFFSLKGENFNGNKYAAQALDLGAKYAIIDEPEFKTTDKTILVENVLKTLQNLATYHRNYLKTTIIALTGSNGKTTTKELINTVLKQKYNTTATIGNLNNHIGVPLTLLSMTKKTEVGIIEMGANHQKEIDFLCNIAQPDFGYITNFGKAHLEGFGGVEGVIKGKAEMYNYLIKNDKTIFVNLKDPIQIEKTRNANTFSFGTNKANINIKFIKASPFVFCTLDEILIKSKLIGAYNYNNIAAAMAIGKYFKLENDIIKKAIENYTPTNNRSQIVKIDSHNIILDAYNANPTSMQAAILNLEKQSGNTVAILGDMFELGDEAKAEHQNIANLAESLDIDLVIFIGENFYRAEIKSIKFKSFDDFKNEYDIKSIKPSTILIKGSRGMALERILPLF